MEREKLLCLIEEIKDEYNIKVSFRIGLIMNMSSMEAPFEIKVFEIHGRKKGAEGEASARTETEAFREALINLLEKRGLIKSSNKEGISLC